MPATAIRSSFIMACRGATSGGARCRTMVEGKGRCHHRHEKDAPAPSKILLKTRVNSKRLERLLAAGIRWKERNESALDQRHAAQAAALDRKATAIRSKPDSGVPVFDKNGLQNVEGRNLLPELRNAQFRIQDIHLYQKEDEEMATLVVVLEQRDQSSIVTKEQLIALGDEFGTRWGHVHVWANPPQEDGNVVHTINCAHRLEGKPAARILYDGGLWAVEKL